MNAHALGRRTFLLGTTLALGASALGRTRYGGTLRLKLPLPLTGSLDPHALDDPLCALFAHAIFDPLYARDSTGRPYPSLAADMPVATPSGSRVLLRPGLRTASGHALDARDALWSLLRARDRAGIGVLGRFAEPKLDATDPLAVVFPNGNAAEIAHALTNAALPLLPRHFTPERVDATGAFHPAWEGGKLVLRRNPWAARGPAFLDAIEVSRASGLEDALRSFEAGDADVGWLGAGYHRPRPAAQRFDAGPFGWVVLRTGREAGAWGAPGVAERLLDGIAEARLRHLGLFGLRSTSTSDAWGGPPAELLVRNDAPHLVEIAQALAEVLRQPKHELRVTALPSPEIAQRRTSGAYALLLDFVRSLGREPSDQMLAVLTACDPQLALRPPRQIVEPRALARTLPLGIVGELHVAGAYAAEFSGVAEWNLGNAARNG